MKANNLLLNEEFRKETLILCTRRLRTAYLVGIILIPLFGLLDKIIVPDRFIFFMILRVFESVFISFLFLSTYTKSGMRSPTILAMFAFLSVGLIFSIMINMTGGYASTYYAGLNLIILTMVLVMPWNLKQVGFACFVIFLFYLISITVNSSPTRNISTIFNNHMFLLSTMFIALTASYLSNRLRFQEFKGRYELREARDSLEEAYEKLKGLDELKTQFFSNVSHEFRTPLTLILAPSESILKGEGGTLTEHGYHLINTIHTNSLRLLNLINNLLDLSKIDAGKMNLNYEKLDLNEFVRGIVTEVLPLAEKKKLSLKFTECSNIPVFYFDPVKIEKVILNLIYNAVKFTDEKGKITISSNKENKNAVVKIADTGIGIEKKDLQKIFDRFVQLDGTSRRRYEGTGIGLPLAKEFVELHKGNIKVESEIDRGTTITFTLPLVTIYKKEELTKSLKKQDDWTEAKYRESTYSEVAIIQNPEIKVVNLIEETPIDGKKILIVEDNVDMLNFIAIQLKNEYRILKAFNGQEGWETAQKEIPDLIITDIMMPIIDGYELCKKVKDNNKTMHIPIIFLTAKATLDMKIEGYEMGADEYLTKPFNSQELRTRVKSLLNLRKLEREIQERNEELEKLLRQLKETQTQLIHSEKMASLGQLVAGIAHEINNPVHAALMSSGALDEFIEKKKEYITDASIGSKLKDINSTIRSGLRQTSKIVSDLRDFSKKDTTGKKPEDIHKGLESTLHLIHHRLNDYIVIHTNFATDIGNVECSLGQLNQVFLNAIQNAIDAIQDNGDIWITTDKIDDKVRISIRDNGIGIKEDDLKHVFEPFFTTKDVGEGVGLGMSISYNIIKDHNGTINIKSKYGEGTEVIITIPLKQSTLGDNL